MLYAPGTNASCAARLLDLAALADMAALGITAVHVGPTDRDGHDVLLAIADIADMLVVGNIAAHVDIAA